MTPWLSDLLTDSLLAMTPWLKLASALNSTTENVEIKISSRNGCRRFAGNSARSSKRKHWHIAAVSISARTWIVRWILEEYRESVPQGSSENIKHDINLGRASTVVYIPVFSSLSWCVLLCNRKNDACAWYVWFSESQFWCIPLASGINRIFTFSAICFMECCKCLLFFEVHGHSPMSSNSSSAPLKGFVSPENKLHTWTRVIRGNNRNGKYICFTLGSLSKVAMLSPTFSSTDWGS